MKAKHQPRAGFTLIELLVVVLIIGILAAVALPRYMKAVEKSRAAEGMTIVSSLAKAGKMYTLEANQNPQLGTWGDLNINYSGVQADASGSTSQTIGGNWSCRFYDLYVGCSRQGGNINYALNFWTSGDNDNLLQCSAGTEEGKGICKALGCQYAGGLAGTSTYNYNCNRPGTGEPEQPYIPPVHPPCTPQTICQTICPEVPPCTCPPPLPPCTPGCEACDTPPCPCTACPVQPPCACPAPIPCYQICQLIPCPVY